MVQPPTPPTYPHDSTSLRADKILDLERDAYRASHIALYSSFTRAEATFQAPPDPRWLR